MANGAYPRLYSQLFAFAGHYLAKLPAGSTKLCEWSKSIIIIIFFFLGFLKLTFCLFVHFLAFALKEK